MIHSHSLVVVRDDKTDQVYWLAPSMEEDMQYFNHRFHNYIIFESIPSKDAMHKIMHLVKIKSKEDKETATDNVIRIVIIYSNYIY